MRVIFILSFILLFIFSFNAYSSRKINDFEHLHAALLNGDNVAYVVNLKECDLIKDTHVDNTPKTVLNTFGGAINHRFIIKSTTGAINFGQKDLNGPDPDISLSANYTTAEFMAYPNGKIELELKMVSLLKLQIMIDTIFHCYISQKEDQGIKFFKV